MCRSIDALQHVLINKIQTIDEIQSTETLIVLQNPIMRTIKPWSAFLIPYFSTGRSQRVHSVQYATLNKGGGLWQISLLSAAAPRRCRICSRTPGWKAGRDGFNHRNAARSAVGRFICLGDLAGYQLNPRCRRYSDNLSPFYEALQEQKPDLSAVRFGAIGIGSREYDTFVGLSIKSRQNSKIPEQNRQAKHWRSTFLITTFRRIRQKNGWDRGLIYSNKYTDRAIYCG